jgi:hypothetical protein
MKKAPPPPPPAAPVYTGRKNLKLRHCALTRAAVPCHFFSFSTGEKGLKSERGVATALTSAVFIRAPPSLSYPLFPAAAALSPSATEPKLSRAPSFAPISRLSGKRFLLLSHTCKAPELRVSPYVCPHTCPSGALYRDMP